MLNRRMPKVDATGFSMVPSPEIPRSTFTRPFKNKTTFNMDYLIPFFVDEVLPADVHQGQTTIFARLATPVFPLMDGITLETFFFFVPMRLLWVNFRKFMGERTNPADSISYVIPTVTSPAGGFAVRSIQDYMGLPVQPRLGANTKAVNSLPFRAYNFIWQEWFRDQNLQNTPSWGTTDGPDTLADITVLLKRNKKHDYFTSALPWPLKGGVETTLPWSSNAPVKGLAWGTATAADASGVPASTLESMNVGGTAAAPSGWAGYEQIATNVLYIRHEKPVGQTGAPIVYADLQSVAGLTINALRLLVQTQRLLERDARGGTRYTEMVQAHFGARPEDSRLQRPEYIGGGRTEFQTQAIPQTAVDRRSDTPATITNPLGALGAAATATDQHTFTCYAAEHGYIIGLVNVTGEINYQQGTHRMWTRSTRYDFYWPVFAHLGEQAIRNDEIYTQGTAADLLTFGYQERWAEYRHGQSLITGMFKSETTANIDEWHIAEQFSALPVLNSSFIAQNTPITRALSAGTQAETNGVEILFDSVTRVRSTRAMPLFSVPGGMDRF